SLVTLQRFDPLVPRDILVWRREDGMQKGVAGEENAVVRIEQRCVPSAVAGRLDDLQSRFLRVEGTRQLAQLDRLHSLRLADEGSASEGETFRRANRRQCSHRSVHRSGGAFGYQRRIPDVFLVGVGCNNGANRRTSLIEIALQLASTKDGAGVNQHV